MSVGMSLENTENYKILYVENKLDISLNKEGYILCVISWTGNRYCYECW